MSLENIEDIKLSENPWTHYIQRDSASVNYGAIATNLEGHSSETFYLSTAIAYTNGYPHLGHAYEFLSADAIVRYYRVLGYDTFFLTGTDEHGQKVAAAAEKCGRTPIDHCNIYVEAFKALCQRLAVSYSSYIRTTDPHHEDNSRRLWELCAKKGDIYLDTYEGWYNEREELFVTQLEAEQQQFIDQGSGQPLKRVQEESYFFRMSSYADRLIKYIEDNPLFIQPEQYRNNILSRLRNDPLKDLSISRTTFSWGIKVPEGFNDKHVMYVWFDALSNYLSGVEYLDTPQGERAKFWPPKIQLIGKDIIWFHCVIWPIMLMSAEIPLPVSVYSHGFVNAADGRKMAKSNNNGIDPNEILDKYTSDTFRYYSLLATPYGSDLNFSESALVLTNNSDLADTLGNLVHRAINLCIKYCNGFIPDSPLDGNHTMPISAIELDSKTRQDMVTCSLSSVIFRAMECVREINRYLTVAEPWKLKGEAQKPTLDLVIRITLESLYIVAHFLAPVIPHAADDIFISLNTAPRISSALLEFGNLTPGTQVTLGKILFTKIDLASVAGATSVEESKSNKSSAKQQQQSKAKKDKASSGEVVEVDQPDFTKIELRVGEIKRVWHHESADRLFCEEIDIGESTGPREIASGLREHYTLEQMQGRKLIVVCNLKEAKLVGFVSKGMVLAAKGADGKVELVSPPEGASVGERVFLQGMEGEPFTSAQVKKFKVWETLIAPYLKTNDDCTACWNGLPLLTSAGPCTVVSASNSPIS